MRILFVVNGFPPTALGGVEVYTADIARRLHDNGHEVLIVCRESDHSKPDNQVLNESQQGIQIIRIVNDFKHTAAYSLSYQNPAITEIVEREIKEFSPQVIHVNHLIALSAAIPLIAMKNRIPLVISLHDYWPICHRVQLIDWLGRWCPGPRMGGDCVQCVQGGSPTRRWIKTNLPGPALSLLRKVLGRTLPEGTREIHYERGAFVKRYDFIRQAILEGDRILTPSSFVRNQYVQNGYPPDRIEVLPLGIKIPEDLPQQFTGNEITFGFVGSLLPIKGIHTLIEAFRSIPATNIKLDIHGREDLYPSTYVQELKELAVGDHRIHFMGSFEPSQRNQIYSRMNVLVIPSIAPETFSIVAREALVRGLPVIASMVGALPEIILHGINGYLFKPEDPIQLANFIRHLAKNPNLLRDFDIPGPVAITSIPEHVEKLGTIYKEISKEKSPISVSPA